MRAYPAVGVVFLLVVGSCTDSSSETPTVPVTAGATTTSPTTPSTTNPTSADGTSTISADSTSTTILLPDRPELEYQPVALGLIPEAEPESEGLSGSGCSPPTDQLDDGVWFGSITQGGGLLSSQRRGEVADVDWLAFSLSCFLHIGTGRWEITNTELEFQAPVADFGLAYAVTTETGRSLGTGLVERVAVGFSQSTLLEWPWNTTCIFRQCPVWIYVNDGLVTDLVEFDERFADPAAGRGSGLGATTTTLVPREAATDLEPADPLGLWRSFRGLDQAFLGCRGCPQDLTLTDIGTGDLTIAVGPDRMVLGSQELLAIFDKRGQVIDAIAMDSGQDIFESVNRWIDTGGTGKYFPYFDSMSDRWFITSEGRSFNSPDSSLASGEPCVLGECPGGVFLAVSKNATPESLSLDDWYVYEFDWTLDNDVQTRRFATDPRITFNEDVIVFASGTAEYPTAADFEGEVETRDTPLVAVGRAYVKIRILEKEPLLRGESVNWVDLIGVEDPIFGGALDHIEAVAPDPDNPRLLFIKEWKYQSQYNTSSTCDVGVFELVDPLGEPQMIARVAEIPDPSGCDQATRWAPQLDGAIGDLECSEPCNPGDLYALSDHFSQAMIVGNSLWHARTVASQFRGPGSILWYQLDLNSWPDSVQAAQWGVHATAGYYYDYPAIAADSAGNAVIVYRKAAADQYPDLVYAGRLASDPPGTLSVTDRVLRQGEAPFNFRRAGYWYAATLDRTDESLWMLGQWSWEPGRWSSWIGVVRPQAIG